MNKTKLKQKYNQIEEFLLRNLTKIIGFTYIFALTMTLLVYGLNGVNAEGIMYLYRLSFGILSFGENYLEGTIYFSTNLLKLFYYN